MSRVTALELHDVRFPTSGFIGRLRRDEPGPDYSASCRRICTDGADGLEGHAFVFTIGRGNEVQVAGIRALECDLVGRDVLDRDPARQDLCRAEPGRAARVPDARIAVDADQPGRTRPGSPA